MSLMMPKKLSEDWLMSMPLLKDKIILNGAKKTPRMVRMEMKGWGIIDMLKVIY